MLIVNIGSQLYYQFKSLILHGDFHSPPKNPAFPQSPQCLSGWGGRGISPPLYIYVLGVSEAICEGMEEIGPVIRWGKDSRQLPRYSFNKATTYFLVKTTKPLMHLLLLYVSSHKNIPLPQFIPGHILFSYW